MPNMKNYFLRSLISEKGCHYLSGDMGGEGIMKKVTNCNTGKEGSKIWHGDNIMELPQCNVL